MIAVNGVVVAVLAQMVLGVPGVRVAGRAYCEICGVSRVAVLDEIARLQTSRKWRDREDAAHELRHLDWRCHPEVVDALAFALLNDPEEEVREESAQSLTRMAPCLPVAHQALRLAAQRDPDHSTRRWARRGLEALPHRCEGPCPICGPVAGVVVTPLPNKGEVVVPADPPTPVPLPDLTPSSAESLPPPIESRVEPPAPAPLEPSSFSKGPELYAPGTAP